MTQTLPTGAACRTCRNYDGKYNSLELVNVLLTKKCNLRCDYCLEDKSLSDEHKWDNLKFAQLLDWILEQGSEQKITVSFFGGEPLLEWRLLQDLLIFGMTYPEDKIDFNISTNIVLLTPAKQKWLRDNVGDRMSFLLSLDGFENVNSRHVAKDSENTLMDEILENLQYMQDECSSLLKRSAFRVSVVPKYLAFLKTDLERMLTYAPSSIIIHPVTTDITLGWNANKFAYLSEIINNICLTAIRRGTTKIECMEGIARKEHNCGAGHSMLGVNADGSIYSCYFTAHSNDVSDIVANFITGVVNTSVAKVYFDVKNEDPKCAECDVEYCNQCHVKNLHETGKHFGSSYQCKELALLYGRTLEYCNKTVTSKVICESGEAVHKAIIRELKCNTNSIAGYVNAILKGDSNFVVEEDCGCSKSNVNIIDLLQAIEDLSTINMTLQMMHKPLTEMR